MSNSFINTASFMDSVVIDAVHFYTVRLSYNLNISHLYSWVLVSLKPTEMNRLQRQVSQYQELMAGIGGNFSQVGKKSRKFRGNVLIDRNNCSRYVEGTAQLTNFPAGTCRSCNVTCLPCSYRKVIYYFLLKLAVCKRR